MGVMLNAKCTKCDFSAVLHVGGGMRDISPETALALMNPADAELFSSCDNKSFSISRTPCRCISCGAVYAGASVDWQYMSEHRHSHNVCPACGSAEKEEIDINAENVCPGCGGIIEFSEAGLWD